MTAAMSYRFHRTGGAEVLVPEEGALAAPGPGQVQIRQEAIGVNYIDIYHRTGFYPLPLPSGIGVEGAGVVEAVGEGVAGLAPGDRIAYVGGPPGAYATLRHIPAARCVPLPEGIDSVTAASLIFKGLTVEYLIRRCHEVRAGDTVLWHAAAGGVGLIACQWLRHIGATVIGTVRSDAKAEAARAAGCDHPINVRREDFVARVREITGGEGVSAAYDSIGGETFQRTLDCLRPRGLLASFGTVEGPVAPLDLGQLGARGSLYVTRPSIAHYTARPEELSAAARALFDMILAGHIACEAPLTYALADAARAQRDLEGGRTSGSVVLIP